METVCERSLAEVYEAAAASLRHPAVVHA